MASQDVLTAEQMRNSKPMELTLPTSFITLEFLPAPPKEDKNNTRATFVDDTDEASKLLTEPFQSVDYLFFEQGEGQCWNGSTYVADLDGAKDIIFTAAQNLWYKSGVSKNSLSFQE